MKNNKLIRITTIPVSLGKLLGGQLSFMSQFYNVIGVSSDYEYLSKVGVQEGVEVKAVEMTRQITPLKDLKSVYELYKYFKKEKPLIVHTHTPKAGTVGMIAAKLAGVPFRLHTIAGLPLLEAEGLKRIVLNLVEKVTYNCATKIYPNSFVLKNIIINQKLCVPEKLKVIGNGSSNGIDTSHFNPSLYNTEEQENLRKVLNLEVDDFVFVFVGRLVKDKGINELVESFKSLSNKKAKLILVGPFELKLDPVKDETLREIENNENIVAVGLQSDVRPYFAISDALVFPSYREGFPNVVLQAGAMDLPSIVTNINGCNEIVIDQENGLIIPVKSVEALTSAMALMMSDTLLYLKLKKNARSRIVENFEQVKLWHEIAKEYESLISNQPIKNY